MTASARKRTPLLPSGGGTEIDLVAGQRIRSFAHGEMLRADAAQIQYCRELRRTLFNPTLFGEPAWDILVGLCVIDNCQRRLSTGQLSKHSGLSLTTTLRWLGYLEQQGLVKRVPGHFDQRMVDVELSEKGRTLMHRYFTEVRQAVV